VFNPRDELIAEEVPGIVESTKFQRHMENGIRLRKSKMPKAKSGSEVGT
jgi:hypothetical protein